MIACVHRLCLTCFAEPNYAKIYAFLGSLFDPATDNHVAALNLMSPTDRETVQVMMNNLAVNLHNSIASMERGDVIHSNPNAHHHPVPKEPPVFRPDRPRLGDDLLVRTFIFHILRNPLTVDATGCRRTPRPRAASGRLSGASGFRKST